MADINKSTDQSTVIISKADPYRETLQNEDGPTRGVLGTGNARPALPPLRVGTPPDYLDSDIIDVQSFTRSKYINSRPNSTPDYPRNLASPAQTSTTIDLTWSGVLDSEITNYNVYYSVNISGPYTKASVGSDTPAYQIGSLAAETEYNIYVTAVDANGNESIQSPTIQAITPGV